MQRRLATIVIADVVGYSALIHADEAGTRAKFRALAADVVAPLTATHSGRLIKTMGDAFFLEFASAVEAVSFAAELQDQIGASDGTALTLRIGINLGDVIVEDDDIHGEGVNIAARLEPIAVPGGVCVSAKVYEEVRGKLDLAFSDGGERELKNIAEPVHVYHLGGDKVPPVSRTNATLADETKPIVNVPAFTFTGKGDDVAELAEGLRDAMIEGLATFNAIDVSREEISRRADYVLKGGVRGAGNRIRINFSLLDCATGVEFWARRYDRTSEDLFEIEDEISSTVILIIRIRLNERAAARLAGTDVSTLNVQQLLTKAAGIMVETTGGFEPVKSYLEMALEKDPENSMGHGMLAFCHWRNHEFSPMDIAVESKDMIIDYCARSRALDPGSYVALFITAVCHGDLLGDRRAMLHALRISPGYQQGQTTAAIAKAYLDPNANGYCGRKQGHDH